MCDKPIASVLWEFEDVAGHWDRMILRAFAWIAARGALPGSTLDAMLPVEELIRGFGALGCPTDARCSAARLRPKRHPPRNRFEIPTRGPVLKRRIGMAMM